MKNVISDGIEFKIRRTAATVVGLTSGHPKNLIIPPEINGVPVNEIGEGAFFNQDIYSVHIPDTVEYVQKRAFKDCKNLTTVTKYETHHPAAMDFMIIMDSAFKGCVGLLTCEFKSLLKLVSYNAFDGCTKLTTLSAELGIVRRNAFLNCSALETVNLGYMAHLYSEFNKDSGIRVIRVSGNLECSKVLLQKLRDNNVEIHCQEDSELFELVYWGHTVKSLT